MYLTYTICSNYYSTTEEAYCVPYLHNMLPLSRYYQVAYCVPNLHNMLKLPKCYQGSILCTLHTQYAPIIILLPHYHTTKVAFCVPYLHNMLRLAYNYPIIILPR